MNVGLEDRRQEVKRPPTPPRYIAFSGQGMSMSANNNNDNLNINAPTNT